MLKGFTLGLLLHLLGLTLRAQELPPPGGWPLRPVTALPVVPEPPGGLVPYRKGQLWGYADTTGRVWIQPQFEQEPPLFGQGLLLRTGEGRQPWWHLRYGMVWWELRNGQNEMQWSLARSHNQPPRAARSYLLNARGEQLVAEAAQAIVTDSTGRYRAVKRAGHRGQPELLVVQPRLLDEPRSQGRRLVRPIEPQLPRVPGRLRNGRRYGLEHSFNERQPYRFAARKVDWLRPKRLMWVRGRCGDQRQQPRTRYRYGGRQALFDERGRRLTAYQYYALKPLTPGLVLYDSHGAAEHWTDYEACRAAGLPQPWALEDGQYNHRYGLLTLEGRELTPCDFLSIRAIGRGRFWVVATRQETLHYGVIDSLGRFVVPLAPQPLSPADAAGLLRRRSAAPRPQQPSTSNYDTAEYPDTATISYLRPDGRLAFPGRFQQAGAFWQGRALVRQHGRCGIIDTLGRWVLPPQDDELSYYNHSSEQHERGEAADPLSLFNAFDRGPSYVTAPADSVLLLVKRRGAYGLIGFRSGRTVIEPCFDKRPEQWRGAVYGLSRGEALVVTVKGQRLRLHAQGETLPADVGPYNWSTMGWSRPALERTPQGYRTRGGRQLWEN
ncbi:hypothetical protein EJV47_14290 [Hymenobacter gummosus]|uniref:WG repeat-containing protein n=1 Tax=Hymenobacter gummosus TaxID=1776032 RepID=A0A431U296_9BACT|nr:WG repeat-containing protein [Hymenobacter gummosus]RTQ49306.1 hypothetical protein EJV47_14290 [Hymenobacter gummosus]